MTDIKKMMDDLYKEDVEEFLVKEVKITAFQVFKNVVQNTPVGNPDLWKNPEAAPEGYVGGSARQSWNIDINVIDTSITKADSQLDTAYDGNDKALRATARYKLRDVFYISNSIPYIERLDEGHSSQAPKAFIQGSIQVGMRQADELGGKA